MQESRKRARWMMYGMLATLAAAMAGGLGFMYSGLYSVAATSQHTPMVHWALEQGMRASVRRHAAGIEAPAFDAAMLRKGAYCFDVNCVQCHGGPGRAPQPFSMGLLPNAKSLVQTGRDWPPQYIYWVTRHGIRMAGMPAWELRLDDRDLWAIAGFVRHELPALTVEQYRERVAGVDAERCDAPLATAPPDAARGQLAMRQYGCHGCHIVPGITGSEVHVGPPLRGFARRPLIAGAVPNTPENLIQWLRDPQSLRPRTLMPRLGVTEQHARDIQSYLATLD